MKTETLNIEATDRQIENAVSSFNPFGYLDMKAATNAALQAGKDTDFVYESVNEFCESTNSPIDKCDPVYCVMDAIFQEARNEITEITNFDMCNDCTASEFYTYGNFMCSSYSYEEESKKQLINALKKAKIQIENLSDATQYFLSEVEISQEDISPAKRIKKA